MNRFIPVLLMALVLAGCSPKEPADTSNPGASEKWIAYCHKEAGKSTGLAKVQWLAKAYKHAEAAGMITAREQTIPDQVLALSKPIKSFDGFRWAVEHGATVPAHYQELAAYAELGREWRDKAFEANPETLPIFMSLAVDDYDRKFFTAHAAAMMQRGFKVKSPLESTEFKIRYRKFVGVQLQEALEENDEDKIRFLISVTPAIGPQNLVDAHTRRSMQATADFVMNTLQDETLAGELLKLNWPINPLDFENLTMGDAFLAAYRTKPDYVIRTQGLDKWDGRMSAAEARFISTLPETAWALLPKLHLDELTEESIKMSESDAAARVIAFKAEQEPLTQADYNELVSWALKYGNRSIFEFVIRESGELDIYNIDFAALAENQKLFELYAPKVMNRVYYSMDTELRDDGITIGNIKRAFGAKNEKAGLWLVHQYDLSKAWVNATSGRTLLMDVCEEGNLLATRYLVEKRGEDIRQETGYSEMQMTIFGSTKPKEGKLSPIFFAAKSGNPELIKYLASNGAGVNARSNYRATPLMYAVSAGHIESVKMLIALRANVNAEMSPNLKTMDLRKIGSYDDIKNAYRRAASTQQDEILRILVQAGAHP